jgi:hypothetical protein
MAVKHRKSTRRTKKIATIGAATATVTALTVGVAQPAEANAAVVSRDVNLQAGVSIFPPPDQIPDLTGGLGTQAYNLAQLYGAQLANAIVDNISLAGLAQALGLDPETQVNNLLNQALGGVLNGVIGSGLTVDAAPVLNQLGLGAIVNLLGTLGVSTQIPVGQTIFSLLGVDPNDPLAITDKVGIRLITSGAPFGLLRLLGADLGWTPPFPNSVADQINSTPYLQVGLFGLLNAVGISTSEIDHLNDLIKIANLTGANLPLITNVNAVDLRVPIVVGYGLGAFAAGAAYSQVVADLPNQPGGTAYTDPKPLLGSFTILPMLLINNPGRANGGILARAYPLFGLAGIDTVTPDTQVQHSGGIPIANTGLAIGGANLIPIKIDATAEYQPLSDFAAWPNPFTLANNAAAGLFPTYILRSLTTAGITEMLTDQLTPQLTEALTNTANGQPLALNFYLTLPAQTLPLLEPTYLAVDAINLLTGANLNNPVATALSPVLTSLVNLGYTDVYYNPTTGEYDRTLNEADVPTAFGTLPNIDWSQVPGHLATELVSGVQKAVSDGLVNQGPAPVNAISALASLLGLGSLSGSGSSLDLSGLSAAITNALNNLSGGLSSPLSATQAPNTTSFAPQAVTQTGANSSKLVSLEKPAGTGVTDPAPAPNTNSSTTTTNSTADDTTSTGNTKTTDNTKKVSTSANAARDRVNTSVTQATKQINDTAKKATKQISDTAKQAGENLNNIAKKGQDAVKKTVAGATQGTKDTADKAKAGASSK